MWMITFGETEVTKRLAAWGALIAVADLHRQRLRHELVQMPE